MSRSYWKHTANNVTFSSIQAYSPTHLYSLMVCSTLTHTRRNIHEYITSKAPVLERQADIKKVQHPENSSHSLPNSKPHSHNTTARRPSSPEPITCSNLLVRFLLLEFRHEVSRDRSRCRAAMAARYFRRSNDVGGVGRYWLAARDGGREEGGCCEEGELLGHFERGRLGLGD